MPYGRQLKTQNGCRGHNNLNEVKSIAKNVFLL